MLGVDAARGLALLGMIAVHIVPPVSGDGSVSLAFSVFAGRSAALFAVLAGVGLALLTRWGSDPPRWRRRHDRVSVATRAVLLVLIGLILGELDSGVAVILVYYGVLFVLALPFLGLGARALAAWSAVAVIVTPAISHLVREWLPAPSYAVPTVDFIDQGLPTVAGELLLTGYYPAIPWMAYLLAGLAVGRLDLRSGRVATQLTLGGTALAVGSWGLSRLLLAGGGLEALSAQTPSLFGRPLEQALQIGLFGTTPTGSWWWLAVAAPHTATPLDLAGTIGASLAVLGLCLLLIRRPWPVVLPLVAVGSMTLSAYSAHVVLLSTVLPRTMDHAWLWHAVVLMTGALLWRITVGQGPLEYLTQRASRAVANLVVQQPRRTPDGGDPVALG